MRKYFTFSLTKSFSQLQNFIFFFSWLRISFWQRIWDLKSSLISESFISGFNCFLFFLFMEFLAFAQEHHVQRLFLKSIQTKCFFYRCWHFYRNRVDESVADR